MTSYRTMQGARDQMVPLQQALRSAILSDSTEEMSRYATDAMAIVDGVLQMLRSRGDGDDAGRSDRQQGTLLDAAERVLTQAWDRAEKVALATSAAQMRERVLDFKTFADFGDAYLSVALGTEL